MDEWHNYRTICHLPCTVKTVIYPWRECLLKVPEVNNVSICLLKLVPVMKCRLVWCGSISSAVVGPYRCTVQLMVMTWAFTSPALPLPQNLWHLWLCSMIKLQILKYFIVASLMATWSIIMLSNQHLDMPELWGGWNILAKKCSISEKSCMYILLQWMHASIISFCCFIRFLSKERREPF